MSNRGEVCLHKRNCRWQTT